MPLHRISLPEEDLSLHGVVTWVTGWCRWALVLVTMADAVSLLPPRLVVMNRFPNRLAYLIFNLIALVGVDLLRRPLVALHRQVVVELRPEQGAQPAQDGRPSGPVKKGGG